MLVPSALPSQSVNGTEPKAGTCAQSTKIKTNGQLAAIHPMEPTSEEREDNQYVHLPRIGFEFNKRDYGRLRQMIDVLNGF